MPGTPKQRRQSHIYVELDARRGSCIIDFFFTLVSVIGAQTTLFYMNEMKHLLWRAHVLQKYKRMII